MQSLSIRLHDRKHQTMTRSLKKQLMVIIALLTLLGTASCGTDLPSDPIDAIPAGTERVTVINLDRLSSANGASQLATGDGLTPAAEDAIGIFLPSDLLRPLAATLSAGGKGIDTSRAVLFTAANGYTGLILKVTDFELMKHSLAQYRDSDSDFGPYEAYTTGRRIIALSETLCVIAPDAATVKTVGKSDGQHLISAMEGVREFLKSDNAINSATPADHLFGHKMDGLWLCASLRFTSSAAIANVSAMHPDGRPDSIGQRIAGGIDPDVLRFVPAGSSLVIASGLQGEDAKLFGIEELLGKYFPGDIAMSRSGTTLWYARPAGTITPDNLLSPQVWNFAGIIQMPDEEGTRAVSRMQQMNDGLGKLDPSTGCYTLADDDASITYGYIDGYFVQSANGPVSSANSNPFTQDFNGARVAAIIDIPGESSLRTAAGLPCGASLTVKVTTFDIHAKLAFYGNTSPVLSTINSIPTLHGILPYIAGLK